jgi:hypothetical protein
VPVEIKQLVIKSKTISDDAKFEQLDTNIPSHESENKQQEKGFSYHLISSSNETRER